MSKTIVALRVYKGQVLYKADGSVANENQKMTIEYEQEEYARKNGWNNHIANLPRMGYSKVELIEVFQNGTSVTEHPAMEAIKNDIANIYKPQDAVLTPEQKRIAELEAKLEALISGQAPQKKAVEKIEVNQLEVVKPETTDELKTARAAYEKHFGKKGFGSWDVATLYAKIEEDKSVKA
jgi:hypothetical protein